MTNIIVLTSKASTESAKFLAESLGGAITNPYETKERNFEKYDYVFKYGFSRPIKAKVNSTFNKTEPTQIAIDKIKTFNALAGTGVAVEYTTDLQIAQNWVLEKNVVVARSEVAGNNGDGLTYVETIEKLNNTPAVFWTKLVDEAQELRVYLWRNEVLSIYTKERDDVTGTFIFKLEQGQENHPQLIDVANKVYKNIGLDFCGIDIITDVNGKLNVLEVNSAPILFPFTCKKLVGHINKEINK